MSKVWCILRHWLPIATAVTALSGLVYLAVQQELRQSANDPQIQLAQDAADVLARGGTADGVVPRSEIDVARSLAPFMIVYDDQGEAVASSGALHGQIPSLPAGVLDYVRENSEDRVTWQPEAGVRIAAVIVRFEGAESGFVLAGRSLREIEKRETQVELEAGLALAATLAATLVVVGLCELFLSDRRT
ncbi:MAG: hypothetical protein MUO38_09050 [Anaerolineales bacterium]|nr:hypothetical protein [Anaerolineales bacterium]